MVQHPWSGPDWSCRLVWLLQVCLIFAAFILSVNLAFSSLLYVLALRLHSIPCPPYFDWSVYDWPD